MCGSEVFWLFLYSLLQLVASDAYYSMKLMTFYNFDGTEQNGDCCDKQLNCVSECDHNFKICLENKIEYGVSNRCVDSGVIPDMNAIHFTDKIGNIDNLIVWKMNFWPGKIKVTFVITDIDHTSHNVVDSFITTISTEPSINNTWKEFHITARTWVAINVKVNCGQDYYGSNCTQYCKSNASIGHYECDKLTGQKNCLTGFKGNVCDQDVNECFNKSACNTHGDCINIKGSFICNCQEGYTGKTCEVNINDCHSLPCKNGAKCTDLINGFQCQCPAGFTGKYCDEDINECLDGICKNGANCTNLDGSFECSCSSFWQGRTCEENVDECLSDPCNHGGTCVDINEGFLCACPTQFVGSLCQEDVDECNLEKTCENNSTCINSFGSFACKCLKGWRGHRCEEDINECVEDPSLCSSLGTRSKSKDLGSLSPPHRVCMNTYPGYVCTCSEGYAGQNCELDIDTSVPFYLACLTPYNRASNERLGQMFLDTQLFQGKELKVTHRIGTETSTKGQVVTPIYPAVTVDGKLMPDHEIVYVVNMIAHKIKDYLRCSVILNTTQRNTTVPPFPLKSNIADWYPGIFIACALLVIAVIAVVILHYHRRNKLWKPNKNPENSLENSSHFSNRMYVDSAVTFTQMDAFGESAELRWNLPENIVLNTTEDSKPDLLIDNPTDMSNDEAIKTKDVCSYNSFKPAECEPQITAADHVPDEEPSSATKAATLEK